MNIGINISLPELWGGQRYEQDEWGHLNFLIGPNGTGKTRFAKELESQISGYQVRFLSAERLSQMGSTLKIDYGSEDDYRHRGKEAGTSTDAIIELHNKPDLRARLQAILSNFFDREIGFRKEYGQFIPYMKDRSSSKEYDFGKSESHGLKELISLLVLIHDDTNDVMLIDEPELHLHPQYQRFLLQEIQKVAGHPDDDDRSKAFFLITHSPSMIEFRNLEDLTNIYSFRSRSRPPYSVDGFEGDDEYRIRRLLPRLNTRHKEVLFSRIPILVEGYTDEEIYSIAIEKHSDITDDPKSTIIGVGGKHDLDPFLRFFRNFGLQPRLIADLDVLFQSNLRGTISDFSEVRELLQGAGLNSDLTSAMGEALRQLHEFAEEVQDHKMDAEDPEIVRELGELLKYIENSNKKQYYMFRALRINDDAFKSILDNDDMRFVRGRVDTIVRLLSDCGYHILRKGELEDYLTDDNSIKTKNKNKIFDAARDRLIEAENTEDVAEIIGELEPVLKSISISQNINIIKFMEEPISEWMHDVQWAVREGEINSIEELRSHDKVGESRFKRLFKVESIDVQENSFRCEIRLDRNLDPRERSFTFSEDDIPASIKL
jgi:predicted ATPase